MAGPSIRYGTAETELPLPPTVATRVVTAAPPPAAGDPVGVVAAALDAPEASVPLEEAARGKERVTVAVPDATRASGADVYLLPVIARLARAGLTPRNISVVIARGIHPPSPRSDIQRLLGPAVMDALHAVQNAPDAPDMNETVGHDEEIGEIRVHRLAAEADLLVLTGAVVPHHLAGFGGGAKAFVPGLAQRETVLAAHRLTLRTIVRPDGAVRSLAGTLEENPFHEALLRVARRHGRCFLLSVVLGQGGRITAAAAGEVGAAHEAAVRAWRSAHPRPDLAPADLVVAGCPPPYDRDLVQAHKVLLAARAWARPGAPIVWLARSPGGAGHPTLLSWFDIRRLDRHLAALRRDFHPYGLTAYSIRKIAAEHPVHVVSELARDMLRPMGLLAFDDVGAALDHAIRHHEVRTCTVLPVPVW